MSSSISRRTAPVVYLATQVASGLAALCQASTWLVLCLLASAAPALAGESGTEDIGGCATTVVSRTLDADPTTYSSLLATLQPGDRLRLAPGDYLSGLNLRGIEGAPGACIIIEGPGV